MTTRIPGTVWDPLGPQTALRMRAHDIVCLHTMAGYFAFTDEMFHANGYQGLESHVGIRGDGYTKQWQDLDFRADANGEGNPRLISIETADKGSEFPVWSGSDVPDWTPAQLDSIVRVVRWCCDFYNIPKSLVPDSKPGRRGIAYHRQGIDPWRVPNGEVWSDKRGKVCPGDRRIRQLIEDVIPRVRGEEDDMTEDDLLKALQSGPIRAEFKEITQGAGLDALRPKTETNPDRGTWRAEVDDIVEDVLKRYGLLPPP